MKTDTPGKVNIGQKLALFGLILAQLVHNVEFGNTIDKNKVKKIYREQDYERATFVNISFYKI